MIIPQVKFLKATQSPTSPTANECSSCLSGKFFWLENHTFNERCPSGSLYWDNFRRINPSAPAAIQIGKILSHHCFSFKWRTCIEPKSKECTYFPSEGWLLLQTKTFSINYQSSSYSSEKTKRPCRKCNNFSLKSDGNPSYNITKSAQGLDLAGNPASTLLLLPAVWLLPRLPFLWGGVLP